MGLSEDMQLVEEETDNSSNPAGEEEVDKYFNEQYEFVEDQNSWLLCEEKKSDAEKIN